ncbi:polysaccharide deacetylase family protein [Nanoarchaeota archaeon]
MKTFTLRVDLESDKGIRLGLPKLLDLLKKYDIKASFYLVMGGESNLFELLKHRGKIKGERSIKLWSTKDKLRMALLPKDFVVKNKVILKRILDEGHELGLHGWKHREWSRGLEKINVKKRVFQSRKKYIELFGKEPISFASPALKTDENVVSVLHMNKIKFMSDFMGEKVSKYGEIKNIPVTIWGENKMPVIEYLVGKGKKDNEILEIMKKEIEKRDLISFYIHGMFEARFKLTLLEEIFKIIKKKKIKNKRVIDY